MPLMDACAMWRFGCHEKPTRQVNGHRLCERHYLAGLALVERVRMWAMLFSATGTPEPRPHGKPHCHGWKPYYRLDDTGSWQDIAIRAMEDFNDAD